MNHFHVFIGGYFGYPQANISLLHVCTVDRTLNATRLKRQRFPRYVRRRRLQTRPSSTCFSCLVQLSLTAYSYSSPLVVDSVARRRQTSSKALAMDNPPNANIHTIVKAQIVFLLSTLTEDNFDRNQIEIRSVGAV